MVGSRVALLVATDVYSDNGLKRLRAPQRDATALTNVLADPEIGGFKVETMVNRPAQEIRVRANEIFTEAGRNDLILFYISGHGLKDVAGRLHFATTDTRLGLLESTAVHSQWIRDLINNSLVRQTVVWLDCCYGGAFPANSPLKADGIVDVVPQLTDRGAGIAIMTACTNMQYAFERDNRVSGDAAPSVFTDAIVAGLRSGDADLNDDGEIDAAELYDYVYDWVRQATPNQTPTRNDQVTGQLFIARSKRGLRLSPDLPIVVRQTLRDPRPEIRLAAVDMLYRLANAHDLVERAAAADTLNHLSAGADPTIAEAATDALRKLVGPVYDDDPPEPSAQPIAFTASTPVTPLTLPPPGRWVSAGPVAIRSLLAVLVAWLGSLFVVGLNWSLVIGAATLIWVLVLSVIRLASRSAVLRLHRGPPAGVAFSPDGRLLVCGGLGSTAWDTASWTEIRDVPPVSARFEFSPDGALLATARKSKVWIFGPEFTQLARTLESDSRAIAFNPDGSTLAISQDNNILFWRTSDWVPLVPLEAHAGQVGSLAFTSDGTMMASASSDGDIKLWNTDDLTRVRTLYAHTSQVLMLAFSFNGDFLASVDANRIRIWPSGQSEETKVISNWAGGGGAIAFSPASDLLAYGSTASSIRLVDPATGDVVLTLFGHRKPVTGLAFSPDGSVLASASRDGTVRLWRVRA